MFSTYFHLHSLNNTDNSCITDLKKEIDTKHLKKIQEFDNKLSRNKKYEKEKISNFKFYG